MCNAAGQRILIYSHDTYGLGHLRRSLLIAGELARLPGTPAVLIVTGSPRTQAFDLPHGCDTVKLPAVLKQSGGGYRSRTLPVSIADIAAIRADMIRGAARAFGPDLILVDHSPIGMEGELKRLFEDIERWPRRPAVVLGLRDIIDDADRVRRTWTADGIWPLIERVYDRLVVYGERTLPTTAMELDLERRYPGKVEHVGYLGRTYPDRNGAGGRPQIVVTVGGGGDGQRVLSAYAAFLESLSAQAAFRSVVLTGPFLSERRLREVSNRFRNTGQPVVVKRFVPGADTMMREAAGIISMAGYNTVVEILATGVPALLVPREKPRLEQRIRAERIFARWGLPFCPTDDLGAGRIARFVAAALGHEGQRRLGVDMPGLARTGAAIARLLKGRRGSRGALAHVLATKN